MFVNTICNLKKTKYPLSALLLGTSVHQLVAAVPYDEMQIMSFTQCLHQGVAWLGCDDTMPMMTNSIYKNKFIWEVLPNKTLINIFKKLSRRLWYNFNVTLTTNAKSMQVSLWASGSKIRGFFPPHRQRQASASHFQDWNVKLCYKHSPTGAFIDLDSHHRKKLHQHAQSM